MERKLDSLAWGLFFVWVGVASLAGLGWGVGLLGTGLIVLGAQAVRRARGLGTEGFWIAVGVFFALGGIWQMFDVRVGLVPVVSVLAGLALLLSTLVPRRAH